LILKRVLFCLLITSSSSELLLGQESPRFDQLRQSVFTLWEENRHQEAIFLLEDSKDHFNLPKHQHALVYYLGLLYLELGKHQKYFEVFKSGFGQEFFFSFWPTHIELLSKSSEGQNVMDQNSQVREEFMKTSTVEYSVILPEGYDAKSQYPLLYFLHGNNSNLSSLQAQWQHVLLNRRLIVVLAQSSYARSNFSFDWVEYPDVISDFQKTHEVVLNEHSIEKKQVMIGGFSNGGRFAINRFLDQDIKASGFLTFNPSRTSKISEKDTHKGRGVIITGESDYLIKGQEEFSRLLEEAGFPLKFEVVQGSGHEYPDDFDRLLNESIKFLMEK